MSHQKRNTQSSDFALTAVAAVHTDYEYNLFLLLSLDLSRSVAKRKKTVIYENHADSRESIYKEKIKNKNKCKYNIAQLHTLGYFSI